MSEMKKYQDIERLVIKVGSGFLFDKKVDGSGYIFRPRQMDALTEEAYMLSKEMDVVIVSSGAIATAVWRRGLPEIPKDPIVRAGLAGEGQIYIANQYRRRFEKYGGRAAQSLITSEDIAIRHRRRHLRAVQEYYFRDGVIAVYNENDTVTSEEISKRIKHKMSFGDNDILSALVACEIDADLFVMLSYRIEGLGTGEGKSKEEARRILAEEGIPLEIFNDRYELDEHGSYKPKILNLFEK
jgi:glutamate 5-kinase